MLKKFNNEPAWRYYSIQLIVLAVLFNGIYLILNSLIGQLVFHDYIRRSEFSVELIILIGLTLVYLANLLWRRKQTAWLFTIIVYVFYLGLFINNFMGVSNHPHIRTQLIRGFLIPVVVIAGLALTRKSFNVRSDIQSFGFALRTILIVYLAAFLFGVIGFQIIDRSGFHQEISLPTSIHHTIDQFGLTTNTELKPYTKRASVFLDSLTVISIGATAYALISLFQPIKSRLGDQSRNRRRVELLLSSHHGTSEDFFKVWPHDKNYYFNEEKTAGIAFHVHRGIALVVGDPFGAVSEFKKLMIEFEEFCRLNDWQPSFIHTEDHFSGLYKELDYQVQKIGEEAIVNVEHFHGSVASNKYFRNIDSKFKKQGYSVELIKPPHSQEVINRLRQISNEWLSMPGRAERGFVLGYFSTDYMQKCPIYILRDQDNKIQGFLNQIHSYDKDEYNYDLLRQSSESLGNSSDFILMNFLKHAADNNIKRVNLGLSPLVGIDKEVPDYGIIDRVLKFAYSKGDAIYSFSGLYKFKNKYEPQWGDRYVVYKGGIRGFSRTVTALNVAMKPHRFTSSRR